MAPELFLDLYSPPCRAVYIFARKNGIPFALRPVDLGRGEHLKPEFLKVNPLGKVPALRDGDFLLSESVAILLYLSRKYQTAAHWYPPELQARARVDEYLAWQHAAIQLPAANVYLCKSLLPYFSGQPVDPTKLEQLLGKLTPSLQHLDQKVLAARPFLASEQLSLADLIAFTDLMQPTAVGCDVFQDRPRLAAWRARVEAALGPQLIQEAHRLVLQPRDPQLVQQNPQLAQELVQRLQERLR
ncbi:glutathione S-transferase theta-1-like [Manis pentadactyla]|uniref:glutathione S-transferase theta-1-like n=1 Tax=Manis pentadactyla TaxID=143292 RepID=UPI00255CC95C|nr:glutathione S-transferase theta-1-like [Manis pentadactyla]